MRDKLGDSYSCEHASGQDPLRGRKDDAERVLGEIAEGPGTVNASPLHLAMVHVGTGRYERALEELERSVAKRESFFASTHQSRMFDRLRTEPRYAELVRKLGL